MGRAAKYLTQAERLAARRALRARRDERPEASQGEGAQTKAESSSAQKKAAQKLFNEETPKVPQEIREQAIMMLSSEENIGLYRQFCEGRDSIELEGELVVDEDEFNQLIGPGPYPTNITSNPNFADWPKLHSALHGVMARRYLEYCDDILTRCQKFPEWHIYSSLYSTLCELTVEYNKTTNAARSHSQEGNQGATALAVQNGRWISRIMVYTAHDMVYVKEGKERLISRVCERRWNIRHHLTL